VRPRRPMNDGDPSILGNLPRSRPGTRSQKRAVEERREEAAKPAPAREPPKRSASRARARRAAEPAGPGPRQPASSERGGVVTDAITTATGVAEAGLRVTAEVARAVLRRLPRP
jgi:hypothetical protein